jgi:hypothetical protein
VRLLRIAVAAATVAVALAPVAAMPLTLGSCCEGSCTYATYLELVMSCTTTNLVAIQGSGSCASPDGGSLPSSTEKFVGIAGYTAGPCHYELIFANGFVYSGDVDFTEVDPGCGCPNYLLTSQGMVNVNNPSTTCVADVGDAAVDSDMDAVGSDL